MNEIKQYYEQVQSDALLDYANYMAEGDKQNADRSMEVHNHAIWSLVMIEEGYECNKLNCA